MIDDLDRSIEALLRADLPPGLMEQISISFATPDEQFPSSAVSLPAIDFFLYDVRENRELRGAEWWLERNDRTVSRQPPPIRVDCSYLVTAWASQSSPSQAEDEHRLLGEAMMALLRHATLPANALRGRLAGQEPPLPAAALQPGRLQSMGEFWQALGGKPKAAFDYTVTIGMQPFEPVETGIVEEMHLELYKQNRKMETYDVKFRRGG